MIREIFIIILIIGLIICAIATAMSKKLMKMGIIFTAYSIIMSMVWLMLESPDLAITEAAVGAGVTGILFFVALRRIHQIDKDTHDKETGEESDK